MRLVRKHVFRRRFHFILSLTDKSTCSGGGHGALVAVLTVGFVLIGCAAVIFTYMYTKGKAH